MGPAPKPTPKKYCQYCGKKLERKQYTKKKEDLTVFTKRKYCDTQCMRKAFVRQGKTNALYRAAHESANKVAYLIEGREPKCEICGSTKSIDVHHKDGNYQNNEPSNLQVVCRSCHMKLHRPKPTCKICGKPVKGHGYCEKHYQRYKKYGDPNHIPWSFYAGKPCLSKQI